jgi:hypothetical protein
MDIEPQIGHAMLVIRSMTLEAIVGKDGADFTIEIDGGKCG